MARPGAPSATAWDAASTGPPVLAACAKKYVRPATGDVAALSAGFAQTGSVGWVSTTGAGAAVASTGATGSGFLAS